MPTIDDAIKALEGSEAALRTLDHHHRAAAVYGLDALGLDENGRLKFDRFRKGGDGVDVVSEAANKYLNHVLQSRLDSAVVDGRVDLTKLAPDELARLQAGGYFGISSQDVTAAVSRLKKDFTPEELVKMFKEQIRVVKKQIDQAPLSIVRKLKKEDVLAHVGLDNPLSPFYGKIDEEKVEAPHMLALLDQYRRENAIPKALLEQIGIYKG